MNKLKIRDMTLIAMMAAVIEVCKLTLASIPNVELTTFWIIMFSLYFGKRVYFVVIVFILVEGMVYGVHLWWIMYLYTWPLLVFITMRLKKYVSVWTLTFLSGLFGFLFGFLCSFPYFFIGLTKGSIMNGLKTAFAWWVAGIPFDILHGISNIVLMSLLYHPVMRMMNRYKI